ncbi:MAG: hypothetical protein V3S34_05675 [Hyphomicrobium sp.]
MTGLKNVQEVGYSRWFSKGLHKGIALNVASCDEAIGRDALIHKSLTSIFGQHKRLFLLAFWKHRLAKR